MLLALCEGNPPVTGRCRSQRLVTQSFDVFFDLRIKQTIETPVIWDAIVTWSFDVFFDLRIEQTIETPVIWDAFVLIIMSL